MEVCSRLSYNLFIPLLLPRQYCAGDTLEGIQYHEELISSIFKFEYQMNLKAS